MKYLVVLMITISTFFFFDQFSNKNIRELASVGDHHAYLLGDGKEALQARMDILNDPDLRRISFTTYIFDQTDEIALLHAKKWIELARRGVAVNLIFDGTNFDPLTEPKLSRAMIYLLQDAGANVFIFRPTRSIDHMSGFHKRMHDKLIIAETSSGPEWLITGGRNLQKRYFGLDRPELNNIDYDALIRGTSVNDASAYFRNLIAEDSVELFPRLSFGEFNEFEHQQLVQQMQHIEEVVIERGWVERSARNWNEMIERVDDIRFIHNTFSPNYQTGIMQHFTEMLRLTVDQFFSDAQYFLPTEEVYRELYDASWKTNALNQPVKYNFITNGLHSSYYQKDWPVIDGLYYELDRYQDFGPGFNLGALDGPGKIHSKLAVRDGSECLVWSANIDPRSQSLNLETGVRIRGRSFCMKAQNELQARSEQSLPLYRDGMRVNWSSPKSCQSLMMGLMFRIFRPML